MNRHAAAAYVRRVTGLVIPDCLQLVPTTFGRARMAVRLARWPFPDGQDESGLPPGASRGREPVQPRTSVHSGTGITWSWSAGDHDAYLAARELTRRRRPSYRDNSPISTPCASGPEQSGRSLQVRVGSGVIDTTPRSIPTRSITFSPSSRACGNDAPRCSCSRPLSGLTRPAEASQADRTKPGRSARRSSRPTIR